MDPNLHRAYRFPILLAVLMHVVLTGMFMILTSLFVAPFWIWFQWEGRDYLFLSYELGLAIALSTMAVAIHRVLVVQQAAAAMNDANDVMFRGLNHHVRNALTPVLYSAYAEGDDKTVKVVEDAIARILSTVKDAEDVHAEHRVLQFTRD